MKNVFTGITLIALLLESVSGFNVASSMASSFGGSVLVTGKGPSMSYGPSIEMKKGKDNVPPAMRAQYRKQKEMQGMREQMMEAQQPGADGFPVFNLFVRTPRANVSISRHGYFYDMHFNPEFLIFLTLIIALPFPYLLLIDVVSMWII
jgi:hypothetical protein